MSRLILQRKVKAKRAARPPANPPAPAADDKATTPVQHPPERPDLWKFIQDFVWKHFRWVGVVIIACAGVWWQWDHISKLPGMDVLVALISEKSLPKAVPGKFNVAIAHLDGDTDKHQIEQDIRESLADFKGVVTLSFDRTIGSEHRNSEQDQREGHARARSLLKASGADALIWGLVLAKDGKSVPKLYWTVSPETVKTPSDKRYQITSGDLSLPTFFWQDLTDVLGLLIATSNADFASSHGKYLADKLAPFIQRVHNLLDGSEGKQWNANTRAKVQFMLGNALATYGEQSGMNEPLRQAVTAYREALKERTREKVPLEWAATQNNLGAALEALGERESDPARLAEAVTAYRDALKEFSREKAPHDWAMTQNNLGVALATLGARQSDPARLQAAVTAYREALKERTREKAPLDWAATQNNLGTALEALGERESDPARLAEAVTAYRDALKEYTLEKEPLEWALMQNNLGGALAALGERMSDAAQLEEAVTAYREALKERTRKKVPLDWAATQYNLGAAFAQLGELKSDPVQLQEAVTAYREALKERTREKVPLDWALSQYALGTALMVLGERTSDPARLGEAVRAYEAALVIFREAKADYYIQLADRNLQEARQETSQPACCVCFPCVRGDHPPPK
ncbi:hypothetical protein WI72_26770 [Burkholderia ubonensis]|uniref:tetratricopeptide repeat protein n=1 Tax=Burkholderia ubonensis TaxID=101571 RepID=UPI00075A12EA|nr:tetratricopeptide repeat protein [Burkholderia ubonensis]KVC50325.1 hypothetical protein WI72_26770 [Burkholderia ubonensis]KVD87845.1 hypothetical protein WI90_21725 [Burkholderia ubonensis]